MSHSIEIQIYVYTIMELMNIDFIFNAIILFFRWAVSTLMSRQNTVPSFDKSSENVSALIPLWDMFNHHGGKVRLYDLL